MHIAILYSESRYTPWKENVDLETMIFVYKALKKKHHVSIVHLTQPNEELADLLLTFDAVINLCNGFQQHQQSDIALWLDRNGIHQIANSGESQMQAQDKWLTEKKLHEQGLPIVRSITAPDIHVLTPYVIAKPRFGGCHRNIDVVASKDIPLYWDSWQAQDCLVQPYLTGREFSVAIIPKAKGIDYEALNPIEIVPIPNRELYIAGQSMGKTERELNPDMSDSLRQRLKEVAVNAHAFMGFEYLSRIDFRVWNDQPYILDVNAMPNMHPKLSLFPVLLRHHRISMKELYKRLLNVNQTKRTMQQVNSLAI